MGELKLGPPHEQSDEGVLEGLAVWSERHRSALADDDADLIQASSGPLNAFLAEAKRRGLR